jgi:predicted nucleic acid-binding protein
MTLIDTDVLIDAIRLVPNAVQSLQQRSAFGAISFSALTEMELLVGARNKEELKATQQFIQRFTIVHTTKRISALATNLITRYTLSHGLQVADAIIAATALAYSLPLLSKNQRDYRFIADLHLLPYPP